MNSSKEKIEKSQSRDAQSQEISPLEPNMPPALAGKYEYLQHIGSGAQGDIYKARDLKTGNLVAIKQLRIDQVDNWKAYDLFDREASVLAQLDISGVSKFYEAIKCFDDDPPCALIVQEFIDGVSLESHIRSGQRWTLSRTFDIAVQILDILEKLHHRTPPIVHRDLKPSNIMVCQEDGKERVYLIDFGAVANPIVQGGGSTVAGTFGYMPPEQLMGKPCPESDIYALGATIVYMLSGVSPADIQTLEFRLVIEPHLQAFPAAIMHVLGRMLEPSVQNRLTDYDEIRRYFNRFSKSDFSEIDLNDNKFYTSSDYVEQFKSVKTLWDNGNLQLWSSLPSQTPRKVPDELISIKSVDLMSHRSIIGGEYQAKYQSSIFIKLVVSAFSIFLLTFAFKALFVQGDLTIGKAIEDGIGGIAGWLFFLFFMLALTLGFIWLGFGAGKWTSSLKLPAYKPSSKEAYQCRNRLLEQGQKTIATIVSIQYLPNNDAPREQFYFQYPFDDGFYIHSIPSFRICYKFNPPDDSLGDDLVHQITIHRDPDKHLQPGDPLPILYWIDPKNNRKVCSMPYPFAACDVEDYKDIICYTENGVISDFIDGLYGVYDKFI